MIQGHGGNIFDKARALGCDPMDILDMSSNVNPLGPMPGLVNHLKNHLDLITVLPEADSGSIEIVFSRSLGIDKKQVLAASGTTQLIYLLPLALGTKKAAILGPTYSDYADACSMHNVDYSFVLSDESASFRHDLEGIKKNLESCDTVFICNPNNPTGVLISSEEILSLCERNPYVRFIIDESYLPFVNDGAAKSLAGSALSNLVVLNSMSKIFRIPGLRIGFATGPKVLIEKMRHYMLPWSVNALAQSAVTYLIQDKPEVSEFIENTRAYLTSERQFIMENLESSSGITLFPSVTSFILMKTEKMPAEAISNSLLQDRILIRNCANFKGLSNQFIRISLKTREINQILINKLQSLF